MKTDLLLVNPLTRFKSGNNFVEYLGFSYIASYIRNKGYTVKILDMYLENLNIEETVNIINDLSFKVIGFTSMSSLYIENIETILNELIEIKKKNKDFFIFIGGIYASQNYKKILLKNSNVDYVVRGEGEEVFEEVLHNIYKNLPLNKIEGLAYKDHNKIISNGIRKFMNSEKMKSLPLPARDTTQKSLDNNGIIQVATSRGCFGNCTFCAICNYYKDQQECKWRAFDIQKCVEEIENLQKAFKIDYVDIIDEEFIGPKTAENNLRLKTFINEMKIRKISINFMIYCRANSVSEALFSELKSVGLDRVFLGIEFGSDNLLKRYKKGVSVYKNKEAIDILNRLRINVSIGYIMFKPLMNIDNLRENLEFYFSYCNFRLDRLTTKMAIFPHSELYNQLKNQVKLGQIEWNMFLGDNYPYEFKDNKIAIIYDSFLRMKAVLAKSKSYMKIKNHAKSREDYLNLMTSWKRSLYEILVEFIDKIETVEKDDLKKTSNFIEDFINAIILWDKTYKL